MKKQLYLFVAVMLAFAAGFTSCNEEGTLVPAVKHGTVNVNGADYQYRGEDGTRGGTTTIGNATKIAFNSYLVMPDGNVEAFNIAANPFYTYGVDENGDQVPTGYTDFQVGDELSDVLLVVSKNGSFLYPLKGNYAMTAGKVTVTGITRVQAKNSRYGTVTLQFTNATFEIDGDPFVFNGEVEYPYLFVVPFE